MIVGLGNPGREYEKTRHNCGFRAIDLLAQKLGCKVDKAKFQGLYGQVSYNGVKLLLLKPMTFMNLSGQSVLQLSAYFHVPPQRIIVLFDDISLEPGRLRIRNDGSAGGHNGIKSIIYQLNSDQFPRVKIGIGESGRDREDTADFVLSPLSSDSYEGVKAAPQAVLDIIEQGVDYAMQRANSKKPAKEQKEVK